MKNIPKIIHYIWVGDKQKNDLFYTCLKSWKEFMPNYEIMEWSEDTFNINKNYQVKQALDEKNYAYASDIIRVWALKKYGGIYFDTDLMLIKPIDHLENYDLFLSYESKYWLGSAVIGSIPNHPAINLIYQRYEHKNDISFNTNALTVHAYTASLKYLYNFKANGKNKEFNKIKILRSNYFYPINYMTLKENITEETLGIHYYNGSWHSDKQLKGLSFAKISRKILGKHIFRLFEKIVAKSYEKKLLKEFKKLGANNG